MQSVWNGKCVMSRVLMNDPLSEMSAPNKLATFQMPLHTIISQEKHVSVEKIHGDE